MITWWAILFGIGMINFADTFAGTSDPFRQIVAACYILASLGLLTRIGRKIREGEREKLMERIAELEQEVDLLRAGRTKHDRVEPFPVVPREVGRTA